MVFRNTCTGCACIFVLVVYCIAGKFGGIGQPTAKFKIRQYLIRIRIPWPAGPPTREMQPHNNGCGRSRTSVRARAHSQLFLDFDVHALSEGGERFYYYLPCHCIDSLPKLACHQECHY